MALRVHQAGSLRPRRQGRRHHRYRSNRGTSRPRPGRRGQRAIRLPTHSILNRHPRRLADRSQLGATPSPRMAISAARPRQADEKKAKQAAMSHEEKLRRQENAIIEAMMKIHQRIDAIVKNRATAEALKPWYMLMCKRPCFHNDYLPTFNRPNVHLVDTKGKGITEINEKGVRFEGKQYELDVIIYATGFEVQKTGIYNQIKGENGLELNDKYREGIRTLLGIHSQGYPNLFIMGRSEE